MITRTKISQLEKKYSHVAHKKNKSLTVRNINPDDKLIDKDGNLLTDSEVKRIEIENKEIEDGGGTVIYLKSYASFHR